MNIEELELSLRTEFEGQVKNMLVGIRQEVAEFQKKFEAEFEKHRTQLDRAINDLSERLPETAGFDVAFNESVNEHLRLARDEGAQIAATAFGEAEKFKAETELASGGPAAGGFDRIRDAISAISSKSTQATILQTLVDSAAAFAPRGAFFIVKNDHLVGWKVFGKDVVEDGRIREVHFPASTDTVLSASVRSMMMASAGTGEHAGDGEFLDAIGFGRPERMYAIPLTARGRGVAVLYTDQVDGTAPNVEALETLVRVAGLTVELLAAAQFAAVPQPATTSPAEHSAYAPNTTEPAGSTNEYAYAAEETAQESEAVPEYSETPQYAAVEAPEETEAAVETEEAVETFETEAQETVETFEAVEEYAGEVSYEAEPEHAPEPASYEIPEVERFESSAEVPEIPEVERFEPVAMDSPAEEPAAEEPVTEYAYVAEEAYESPAAEEAVPEVEEFIPAVEAPVVANGNGNGNGNGHSVKVAEPVVEVASPQPVKTRLSDRNVDLPIDVADDERRLHNDARRFARLLVSEIKLYNEQKVTEGRASGDLYDRLREAIDRSREMYDKRVQPAVASKFDYFDYELVNSLAEGDAAKLGTSYKGATV